MKQISKSMRWLAVMLAVAVLATSCASTTLINSIPSGAKVYIDGEPAGTTPLAYSDQKIVGSSTEVKLKKEGYEDHNVIITRDEEVDVGALIAGILFYVPFLWVMKYKPSHTYELTPVR
ncbi:MAG TPA: PEGA domain-containing protein [Bacteroidales bacterium]|nr:PEGA domain-containing protein [Bacteroidales bacterium]HRZ48450.1 PEGA domain-containing protein [Bacteroidales bacterium]